MCRRFRGFRSRAGDGRWVEVHFGSGRLSHRGWQDFGYVELLAPRHRLLMVDPLGHGSSDRPHHSEAYGLEALADHTAAVMDAEGVEAAAMVTRVVRGCWWR